MTWRPPSVSSVLETAEGKALSAAHGHGPAVGAIREAISAARSSGDERSAQAIADQANAALDENIAASKLGGIWNCTGIVLHTNLGRAVLGERAIEAASTAMARPVALEYDVGKGARGQRDDLVADLLVELTGGQSSLLVNNNAAAVLLVLDVLARGGEVIVSRGELIEIGGAFRIPDIMEATGVKLVEVGTTNRTHLRDYSEAITENTSAIMKVHTSNYRIEGFTKAVSAEQLAPLAREHGIPLVNDMGSGTLTDLEQYGLPHEQTVREAVAEGADVVTFSGDKLLGGPQAGLVVGREDLLARMRKSPLKRAMRLDKIRLAALESTLRDYQSGRPNPTQIYLARNVDEIMAQAQRLAAKISGTLPSGFAVEAAASTSQVGSGASPTATQQSAALQIRPQGEGKITDLAAQLRALPEPVIGHISDNALLLDLRCLLPEDESAFLNNLAKLEGAPS